VFSPKAGFDVFINGMFFSPYACGISLKLLLRRGTPFQF